MLIMVAKCRESIALGETEFKVENMQPARLAELCAVFNAKEQTATP